MIGRSIYEAWDASSIGPALERAFAGEKVVKEMEIDGRWFRTQYTPLREEWDGGSGEGIGPAAVIAGAVPPDEERPVVGVVGASMVSGFCMPSVGFQLILLSSRILQIGKLEDWKLPIEAH